MSVKGSLSHMLIKRKTFSVLILLCAGFFLVSCKAAFSPNNSSNLKSSSLSVLCDETAQKLPNEDQQPVSLTYYCMREASSQYEITDADTIRSVLDAILQIRIEKETDLMSTDYDDIFVFTMADGTQCSFSFNNHHFQINKTLYELSNDDDLWKLAKDLQH